MAMAEMVDAMELSESQQPAVAEPQPSGTSWYNIASTIGTMATTTGTMETAEGGNGTLDVPMPPLAPEAEAHGAEEPGAETASANADVQMAPEPEKPAEAEQADVPMEEHGPTPSAEAPERSDTAVSHPSEGPETPQVEATEPEATEKVAETAEETAQEAAPEAGVEAATEVATEDAPEAAVDPPAETAAETAAEAATPAEPAATPAPAAIPVKEEIPEEKGPWDSMTSGAPSASEVGTVKEVAEQALAEQAAERARWAEAESAKAKAAGHEFKAPPGVKPEPTAAKAAQPVPVKAVPAKAMPPPKAAAVTKAAPRCASDIKTEPEAEQPKRSQSVPAGRIKASDRSTPAIYDTDGDLCSPLDVAVIVRFQKKLTTVCITLPTTEPFRTLLEGVRHTSCRHGTTNAHGILAGS